MAKLLRLIIGIVALVVIIAFAIANREVVQVGLAPFPTTVELPVYGVFLLATGRGTGRTPMPLGTFLCAGAALELFAGAPLVAWYRGLFPH